MAVLFITSSGAGSAAVVGVAAAVVGFLGWVGLARLLDGLLLLTSAVLGGGGAGLAAGRAAAAAAAAAVGAWGHTPSTCWHIFFLALHAATTCCLSLPVVSPMPAQTEHQYDLGGVVASKPKPRQHGSLRFAGGRYQGCCQMFPGGTRFGGIVTVLRVHCGGMKQETGATGGRRGFMPGQPAVNSTYAWLGCPPSLPPRPPSLRVRSVVNTVFGEERRGRERRGRERT